MKKSDVIEKSTEKTIIQLADEYYEKKDYSEAFELYKQAAEQGDPRAQYNIGLFYYKGISPAEQSYTVAISWFEKAASQRYSNALYKLGKMYEDGIGVEQNFIEAYVLYRKASLGCKNKTVYEKARDKYIKMVKDVCDKAEQGDADAQKTIEKMKDKEKLINAYLDAHFNEMRQKAAIFLDEAINSNEKLKEVLKMATGED